MYEDKTIEKHGATFSVKYESDNDSNPTDFGGEFTSKAQPYAIDRRAGVMLGDYIEQEKRFDSYLEATRWLSNEIDDQYEEQDWIEDEEGEAGTLVYSGLEVLASNLGRTSWDRNEYQYYMPPVENYKGIPQDELIKYCIQDWERTEDYGNGWVYMGCIVTMYIEGEEVAEASVWGLESDGDDSYFEEIENDLVGECISEARKKGDTYRKVAALLDSLED